MAQKVALYDVMIWLEKIVDKGITVFTFEDLRKHNLDHQYLIFRAKNDGLVREVQKVTIEPPNQKNKKQAPKFNLIQWQIITSKLTRRKRNKADCRVAAK